MEIRDKSIEKIEKKIWQMIMLAVVVILYLTLSILGFQFLNPPGESEYALFSEDSFKLSIFLTILILLFCAYMLAYQRKLLGISKALFKEKKSAENLTRDLNILTALFNISSKINSQQKLSSILNTISSDILNCFRADRSSIMLLNRQSKTLKTMASHGKQSELAKDAIVPLGKSIGSWVLKTGKPLILNGEVNPSDFDINDSKGRNISSAICVPLKIASHDIGILTLNLVDTDRTFSDSDLKLVGLFANNAAVAIQNAILLKEKIRRVRLYTLFQQLHSPHIVRNLVKKISKGEKEGQMREIMEVSILFADIRGFSSIIDMVDIEILMDLLDEFYTEMAKIVYKNEGNIDKFIGDEVMAFFGGPNKIRNSIVKCIGSAVEMKESFQKILNKFSRRSPAIRDLGLGIGINSGEVIIGNVGSKIRYDYTIIGNPVNLARRLCTHAKHGEILTTQPIIRAMNGTISSEFIGRTHLKGIKDPVDIHSISGFCTDST